MVHFKAQDLLNDISKVYQNRPSGTGSNQSAKIPSKFSQFLAKIVDMEKEVFAFWPVYSQNMV